MTDDTKTAEPARKAKRPIVYSKPPAQKVPLSKERYQQIQEHRKAMEELQQREQEARTTPDISGVYQTLQDIRKLMDTVGDKPEELYAAMMPNNQPTELVRRMRSIADRMQQYAEHVRQCKN